MAAELYKNRLVIWRPQPKQAAFMRRSEDEALYGGAAGGGKSDALVIEALRQVDIPHYRGLIVRKTYPQLSELIDKTMPVQMLQQRPQMRFPAGMARTMQRARQIRQQRRRRQTPAAPLLRHGRTRWPGGSRSLPVRATSWMPCWDSAHWNAASMTAA